MTWQLDRLLLQAPASGSLSSPEPRNPEDGLEFASNVSGASPAQVNGRFEQRRRILVVEDNPDGAETLCALLEWAGHEVRVASDGESALGEARRFHPELVLCDIGLPDISGCDVARRLRGEEAGANTILVALTGYGQARDKAEILAAGFDYYFVKPIDPERLIRIVASSVQRDEREN